AAAFYRESDRAWADGHGAAGRTVGRPGAGRPIDFRCRTSRADALYRRPGAAMKVAFLISGHHVPSSRFRILQYVPHLQDRGHECLVLPSRPPKYQGVRLLGNRVSEVLRVGWRLDDWRRVRRLNVDAIV